jgi:predicted TIM-barrel fold metal-dependent hydrolase
MFESLTFFYEGLVVMGTTINGEYSETIATNILGMIDTHAYHGNVATWPVPLAYVHINAATEREPVSFIYSATASNRLAIINGVNRSTTDTSCSLVILNSYTYNKEIAHNQGFAKDVNELSSIWDDIGKLLNGRNRKDLKDKDELSQLDDLLEKERNFKKIMADVYRVDIPSLIVVTTLDTELAHFDGYDGTFIYQEDSDTGKVFFKKQYDVEYLDDDDALTFQNWKQQISDMEAAVALNPYRLFPLFSYDPRRYRLSENAKGEKGLGTWKEPFARIIGHSDPANDLKKIWLGFCMNPSLGFRPFDEFCEYLPMFYKECEEHSIPILAHCVSGGITTHDASYYPDKTGERLNKSKNRHNMILEKGLSSCKDDELCSVRYSGMESVVDDVDLNKFYMNYGHPRNWIPVLEYFPNLRLCLAGFGGNSEWRLADWSGEDDALLPTRLWLRCIIKLTAMYKNVYADISGLNIYDKTVRNGLLKMLELTQDDGNDEFKHLKQKLMFGSGGSLTYLTDVYDGGTSVDGRDSVEHSYSNYCREFKKLFDMADKEENGGLWKCVSHVNPLSFYALTEDTVSKLQDEIAK